DEKSSEETLGTPSLELKDAVFSTVDAAKEADIAASSVPVEEPAEDSPKKATIAETKILSEASKVEENNAVASTEVSQDESKIKVVATSEDLNKKTDAETAVDAPPTASIDEESVKDKAKAAEEEPKHAPDIMAKLEDLPGSYQSNRARLIMVDPERLFLHWNFSLAASQNQSVVMMFRRHFFGQPRVQETVPLGRQSVGTYYFVTEPGTFYDAVFGTVENGVFHELYQSNLVETPPVRPRYSEVAVWKVREATPEPTTPEEIEDPVASVWREPKVERTDQLVAAAAEASPVHAFAHPKPTPSFAQTAPAPSISLPEKPSEPAPIEQSPTVSWVDSDYQPPHMALSNSEASPRFYSDPSYYNDPEASQDLPASEDGSRDELIFGESPTAVMGTAPQLPSVRWIGASEFILVGGPGSLIPPLPGSQGASWNLHIAASEPARRWS
ncbi:MAG: hypothetical protein P1V97_12875, partial [Planctomycetota bacterium]|nr:hypothetical protein [Planctomycetota bacterium]